MENISWKFPPRGVVVVRDQLIATNKMTTTATPTIIVRQTEDSVPTVVLTIAPPSRPHTPQLGSRAADYGADSLPSPSSHLSPIFSLRPNSISETSDDGISKYNPSATDLSVLGEEYGARTTVYHIYRVGRNNTNFTVHSVKDTKLVEQLQEEVGPVVLKRGCGCSTSKLTRGLHPLNSLPPKKIKVDDNETDPRKATYYLHSPCLWFHEPPQTLRFGGDKNAPVVCLIEGSFFWRTWRLGFAVPEDECGKKDKKKKPKDKGQKTPEMSQRVDSGFEEGGDGGGSINNKTERRWKGLNEPGVIDPRGVLVSKYPLRASGRWPGESGKEYAIEKAKQLKSSPATPNQVTSRINQSDGFSKRLRDLFSPRSSSSYSTTATSPPTPDPGFLTEILSAEPEPQDLPSHLRPDSLDEGSLLMKWSGWLTREYGFAYKGVDLRWKGTGTVKDEKKYWGSWSKYNHLKLVATLPDEDEDGEEVGKVEQKNERLCAGSKKLGRRGSFSSFISLVSRQDSGVGIAESEEERERRKQRGGRQVVIAKYTCLAALRKAGRLTIYEHGLEQATSMHVAPGNEGEFDTEKERLRHLTVATALCMLQGEKEKRDTILKMIEILLSGGTDAI